MPDPGNPDQGPKPGKPEPGKGAFGWYKPPIEPPGKFTEPDSDFTSGIPDTAPPTDQALFRAAAIKLAKMEDEISQLLNLHPEGSFDLPMKEGDKKFTLIKTGDTKVLMLKSEELKATAEDGTTKSLQISLSNSTKTMNLTETRNFKYGLTLTPIDNHSLPTNMVLNALASNISATHSFFFADDGQFEKRTGFMETKEMTVEDFEITGTALQMLLDRLKPQEEKSAE